MTSKQYSALYKVVWFEPDLGRNCWRGFKTDIEAFRLQEELSQRGIRKSDCIAPKGKIVCQFHNRHTYHVIWNNLLTGKEDSREFEQQIDATKFQENLWQRGITTSRIEPPSAYPSHNFR